MARKVVKKPIKKRARVRKPNSFAESVRKMPSQWDKVFAKAAKKPKVLNPKFKLKIGIPDGDKFFVHPETIPDGVALQWVSNDEDAQPSIEAAKASGWKLVENQAAIRGLVLMWAPQELADAQRDANIKRALDQLKHAKEQFYKPGGSIGIFPNEWLTDKTWRGKYEYKRVPSDAPPIDVEVTTKFRLSAKFQDAAACLGLTPEVYAQRRLELYLRGNFSGILLPVGHSGVMELFESGNFTLSPSTKGID